MCFVSQPAFTLANISSKGMRSLWFKHRRKAGVGGLVGKFQLKVFKIQIQKEQDDVRFS
jgi:hypothetical protein